MGRERLENRSRAIGIVGAVAVHAAVLAILLWLTPGRSASGVADPPRLVSVDLTETPPPPPPPPDDTEQGAAAPPSRGDTAEPSPPLPIHRLAPPSPAQPAVDPGTQQASGFGSDPGTGAGRGGEGEGTGAGGVGTGRGSGAISPPVHLAGALTHSDYRAADPPRGAAGTVRVSFRVRSDGSVDRCTVLRSSGVAVFDQATCRLIEQRFRFQPAMDAAGRAIDWEIRTDYIWAPR